MCVSVRARCERGRARRAISMRSTYVSGWALMTAVAVCALLVSKLVVVAGNETLEPALLALTIGMLVRSRGHIPAACEAGLARAEQVLSAGLVLMGAELHFARLIEQSGAILVVIVVTMFAGITSIYALGRVFRLPRALALLLSVGTTICGGTAIAIVAPIVRAPEDQTAHAMGTISLWGLTAILIYPLIAHQLGVADMAFGVFAGTAIHGTPQVVGAGFIYSELAGHTATAVKLIRSCFIAPVVLGLAFTEAPRQALAMGRAPSGWRIFPWLLFGFFVSAIASNLGLLEASVAAWMGAAGKQLLLIGMAGVGLNTNLSALTAGGAPLWRIGLRPLVVGLLGSIVVAAVSAGTIGLMMSPWR
jgi:uncharacterized integral membrane protein (TIGR00698 family)